jgi:putative heme-binding domain-containing protein
MLYICVNYYLWLGMERIRGYERYSRYTKFLLVILLFCFAVLITPHNLPLTGEERAVIGEQYHPFSKIFGVMPVKHAAIQFIMLSTFFSFLLYRRANKGETIPFSQHGNGVKIALGVGTAVCVGFLSWYAVSMTGAEDIKDAIRPYVWPLVILLGIQGGAVIGATVLTFLNKGKFAQMMLFGFTVAIAIIYMAVYGFELMEKANLLVRYLTLSQMFIVFACLVMNALIDIAIFARAKTIGGIAWGRMNVRSQYALIFLCVTVVAIMCLMGFIRSGLRMDWHVYGVLRDTSDGAFMPSYGYMGEVIGIIILLFLGLLALDFWLVSLGEKKIDERTGLAEHGRRGSFLKAAGFVFAIVGVFTYISIYVGGISGTRGEEVAVGLDPESGENLFWGDGQCSTCHKVGSQGSSKRGPDQENLFTRAAERAKERGLSSATEYLVESIVDPSAYLVEGYGDIMPKVYEPPIVMEKDQIFAVILYLQSLGGEPDLNEVVKYKDKIPSASKKKVKPWVPPIVVEPEIGEEIFFSKTHEASCSKCHFAKGKGEDIGPELSNIGAVQTPQYIIESILSPSAEIVKGYETVYILTTDGIPFTGIIREEDEEVIVLAVEEAGEIEEIVIYRDEIADMKQQELSMMPANIKELLSVEDFYGVVSFLLTLK